MKSFALEAFMIKRTHSLVIMKVSIYSKLIGDQRTS